MAIEFEIETRRIAVGRSGGYFEVRAMSADDLTYLTLSHLDDMKLVVARHADKGMIQQSRLAELVMDLAKDFPALVVEIISRCADAESAEDVRKFQRISFMKQVEALKAIAELTLIDGGVELGNVARGLISLLEANGLKVGPLTTWLQNTIAMSERALVS